MPTVPAFTDVSDNHQKSVLDSPDIEFGGKWKVCQICAQMRDLGRVGKIETLLILQICPRPSQTIGDIYEFEFSLVAKIWDSRETINSPIVWDFPEI